MGTEASIAVTQKILTYSKTDSLRYQLYVSTIWFQLTLDIGEPTLWGHMGITPGDNSGLSDLTLACGKREIKSGQVLQNRGTQFVLSRPGTVLC